MGDFSTFAGLGGSGAPPDLLNLGFPISGSTFNGTDLSTLLADLNLQPSPLTSGPPPVDTSTLPTVEPLPTGLPPPPELPPNPIDTNIFNPPQPTSPTGTQSGYPLIGPPTFVTTTTSTAPTQTAPPPPTPITQPPPVTVTTSGGGGSVTVNVQVNNAENIANDVIRQLQDAITQGITNSVQAASDIAKGVFGQIADALKNVFTTIWNTLKTVLQSIAEQIGNIVVGIGDALKNAAEYIFKGLAGIFGNLRDVLVSVINKIGPILDNISKHIQKINDTLIAPIANFINTTVRTIAALTVAIEKDLHDGLAGIVRIPGDIAQGISSIDASLNRTIQQLGSYNKDLVNSVFLAGDGTNVGNSLKGLHDGVIGLGGKTTTDTTFMTKETLSEGCNIDSIAAKVAAIPQDFGDAPDWLKWVAKVIMGVLVGASEVEALLAKSVEAAEEQINKTCPLKKLDSGTLVQAWLRNFIDAAQMDEEMLLQGYTKDRSKTLRDLSRYVETTADLSEYRYRNIISDSDFVNGLRILGLTDSQIDAYRQSTQKLLDPQTAVTARQRNLIDDAELTDTLKANRYDDAQATLLSTLAFRPPSTDEETAGRHNRTFLGQVLGTQYDFDVIPDWFTAAGRAQGFDDNTIRNSWWIHFNSGDVQTWIALYFRGLRTYSELQAFMDSRAIPRGFQDDIIAANRPLIPYRSLPTFVKSGIISEARGRSILQAHGFELEDINAIMEAAGTKAKTTKAAAANGIVSLSIANAKTLFNDGAITQDQYESILVQHGYTQELAKAQSEVDVINAHAKSRKQTLSNYAAQVEAGVLTLDDAITQLTQQGFTTPEIQTWQARVIHALRIGTHHPSIASLDKYLAKGYITLQQYSTELQAQGWIDPWLTAQIELVTKQ